MRAKSMVLILIALGCGLVASIAISQVMERGANSGNAALETVQIYVATTDIDANDQLSAENVRVEDWPKSKVPEGAILDFEQVAERFARVRFYEGEPILQAKLANELEGPAIKIPDGFRVCSLKVQMDTAVSGLVNPGDRVDIYGYFRKSAEVPKTGTREILRNVRVFAVNSETEQETDPDGRQIAAKTVSVLVEQKQVAKLMLATELGTLRLALRRPNESEESSSGENATADTLFGTRPESADPDNPSAGSQPGTQLASAAGGFAKFLAGLKSSNTAVASVASLPTAGFAPSGPSWEMVVLTPDGGTHFTWESENGLPQQGTPATMSMPPQGPPALSLPPLSGLRDSTGSAISTGAPAVDVPADEIKEDDQTQQEEENNQLSDDD